MTELLNELRSSENRHFGNHQGKYVVVEDDVDTANRRLDTFEEFVTTVERVCEIKVGIALAYLAAVTRDELLQYLDAPAAETVALAMENGFVLWTDDACVAAFAYDKCGVHRVWTDMFIQHDSSRWKLTKEFRAKYVAKLAACQYTFTLLTDEAVLSACTDACWDIDTLRMKAIMRWFANAEMRGNIVASIANKSLRAIWRQAPSQLRGDSVDRLVIDRKYRWEVFRCCSTLLQTSDRGQRR